MGEKVDLLVEKIGFVEFEVEGEIERLSNKAERERKTTVRRARLKRKLAKMGPKQWKVSSYVAPGGRVVSNRPRKKR